MIVYYNSREMPTWYPLFKGQSIHVAIDSSKTNSAIAVGDGSYNLIGYIEMNGSQDGTTEEATLLLCKRERQALQILFQGANVLSFGIENIITKDSGKVAGMSIHKSRFKITAVFMSFITFFMDKYDLEPHLVNNQEWKSAVLPKELNSRDVHKGSREYLASISPRFRDVTDDVSDAVCILLFMKAKFAEMNMPKIGGAEIQRNEFNYHLFPGNYDFRSGVYKFEANNQLSLSDNMVVVSNNIDTGKFGVFKWSVDKLSFSDIYLHVYKTHDIVEKEVYVVVQNK